MTSDEWTIGGTRLPAGVQWRAVQAWDQAAAAGVARTLGLVASAYEGRGDAWAGSAAASYEGLAALGRLRASSAWVAVVPAAASGLAPFVGVVSELTARVHDAGSTARCALRVAVVTVPTQGATESTTEFLQHDF